MDRQSMLEPGNQLSNIGHVIAVMSGKGGVGKSSVAAMLALQLQRQGHRVGVLDADITGPSIPLLLGVQERPQTTELGMFPARSATGLLVMSLNLLLDREDQPVIWRGPLIAGAIKQFWKDVVWGDLDYLVVDLPPGTGDAPLTVLQSLPLCGVVIVSSPGKLAEPSGAACVGCNQCGQTCRFQAVDHGRVNSLRCEGCGACVQACPVGALQLSDQVSGQVILTATEWGWLSRAELRPGASGSGKLVTAVRTQGFQVGETEDLVILDGSPGVGCSVMATLTGCDAALLVLEPSRSGEQDFLRLLDLLRRFHLDVYVCINRYDLNPDATAALQSRCAAEELPLLGLIPYDRLVLQANRRLKSILSFPDSPAAAAIRELWDQLRQLIGVN
jgi:MinD superfamily P-loop ATPase